MAAVQELWRDSENATDIRLKNHVSPVRFRPSAQSGFAGFRERLVAPSSLVESSISWKSVHGACEPFAMAAEPKTLLRVILEARPGLVRRLLRQSIAR